jgi:monofunctional glycosyltransferase
MPISVGNIFSGIARVIKKALLFLFIGQLVYIVLLKWVNPPITLTQLSRVIVGDELKRDYVAYKAISKNAKLAVIASE